ncbi:MAG: SRPBCC family protein [Leptospirillum sp.]
MTHQTVTVKKILSATCEAVFDAWLDPESVRAWMRPGPVVDCEVSLEPRVGGTFRIVMRGPAGEIVNTGTYRILDRPVKLQFTWVSSRWKNQETLVTVELTQRASDCELVLTHDRFPPDESSEQLTTGWNQILDLLARCITLDPGTRQGRP